MEIGSAAPKGILDKNGAKPTPSTAVDLDEIDPSSEPTSASNCLEYLLITICRSFGLKAHQAAGLLTNGNKYLNQAIIKGIHGNYEMVLNWFQDLYTSSLHLVALIE